MSYEIDDSEGGSEYNPPEGVRAGAGIVNTPETCEADQREQERREERPFIRFKMTRIIY